jgi:hypothetical protein
MKKRGYVNITSTIVVVIALIIAAPAIKRQLNDWKLLPEPERLTELYFTHPNTLPSTYSTSQAQQVAFTVHNLEYKHETYTYQIVEAPQPGSAGPMLASGSFSLAQNGYKNVTQLLTIQQLANRVNLSINLTNVNESVDYWVTKAGS